MTLGYHKQEHTGRGSTSTHSSTDKIILAQFEELHVISH